MRRGRSPVGTPAILLLLCGGSRALPEKNAPAASLNPSSATFYLVKARSGHETAEPAFKAAAAAWESPAMDGKIYAEPLVLGSTVYAATMNNTVYALNAATGAILWSNHLASPVPSSAISCSGDGPVVGIVSTP